MSDELPDLVDLRVRTRHPEHYVLVNEADGTRWRWAPAPRGHLWHVLEPATTGGADPGADVDRTRDGVQLACPDCGEADGLSTTERLYGAAGCVAVYAGGSIDYEGTTEVAWDSSTTVGVECRCGWSYRGNDWPTQLVPATPVCVACDPDREREPHAAHVHLWCVTGRWVPSCSDRVLDWWHDNAAQAVNERREAGAPDAWIRPLDEQPSK